MLTVFWDSKGPIIEDYLQKRSTMRDQQCEIQSNPYADDLVLLPSIEEGAQRQLDRLAEVAGIVCLVINTKKTELLTVPKELEANITCSTS